MLKQMHIKALFFFLSFALCFLTNIANAETQPAADPAKRCVMCHKKDSAKMQGVHSQALNPHDNTKVNCTNCHTAIDSEANAHPKNRSNITTYRPLYPFHNQEQAAQVPVNKAEADDDTATEALPEPSIMERALLQGQNCMSCHTPEVLRERFWPHDVHATQLSCTDCHKLHTQADPVIALDTEKKVELCVSCHAQSKEVQP